jgi:hypothetical protein
MLALPQHPKKAKEHIQVARLALEEFYACILSNPRLDGPNIVTYLKL